MIEIIYPGLHSIIVDAGRFGFGDIGVPSSSAMDGLAYKAVCYLTDNPQDSPVIESIGPMFSIKFHRPMVFAITGAHVEGLLDGRPFTSWQSIRAKEGSILNIKKIKEGFRYYMGFSGVMDIERAMGSFTTNMECHFGGYNGMPLRKGDVINFQAIHDVIERSIDKDMIPDMNSPHVLCVVDGPEIDFFKDDSIESFFKEDYTVSTKSNRTGIRLTGNPMKFKEGAEKSIISEGILAGTIQIPGDGMPIIMLYERTVGGYSRLCKVIRADLDRLAHLKPGDQLTFKRVSIDEALELWRKKQEIIKNILKT